MENNLKAFAVDLIGPKRELYEIGILVDNNDVLVDANLRITHKGGRYEELNNVGINELVKRAVACGSDEFRKLYPRIYEDRTSSSWEIKDEWKNTLAKLIPIKKWKDTLSHPIMQKQADGKDKAIGYIVYQKSWFGKYRKYDGNYKVVAVNLF